VSREPEERSLRAAEGANQAPPVRPTATSRARAVYEVHGEKIRFLVVGVINTAIGYLIFGVLLALLGPVLKSLASSPTAWVAALGRNYYLIVQWVGWVFAVPVSTTTMKYIAFRSKGPLLPQIGRAYFVYLPAQLIANVVLWVMVRVLRSIGLPENVAVLVGQLVTIFVTTIFSYLGHKYFTFRAPLEVGEVPPRDLVEDTAERSER